MGADLTRGIALPGQRYSHGGPRQSEGVVCTEARSSRSPTGHTIHAFHHLWDIPTSAVHREPLYELVPCVTNLDAAGALAPDETVTAPERRFGRHRHHDGLRPIVDWAGQQSRNPAQSRETPSAKSSPLSGELGEPIAPIDESDRYPLCAIVRAISGLRRLAGVTKHTTLAVRRVDVTCL